MDINKAKEAGKLVERITKLKKFADTVRKQDSISISYLEPCGFGYETTISISEASDIYKIADYIDMHIKSLEERLEKM